MSYLDWFHTMNGKSIDSGPNQVWCMLELWVRVCLLMICPCVVIDIPYTVLALIAQPRSIPENSWLMMMTCNLKNLPKMLSLTLKVKMRIVCCIRLCLGKQINCLQFACHNSCKWTLMKVFKDPIIVLSLSFSGLIFLKNPFLSGRQHQWVVRCLTDYPLFPNVCNLDSHMRRKGMGEVWPLEDKGWVPVIISTLGYSRCGHF